MHHVFERLHSPLQWTATARLCNCRAVSELGWNATVLGWPSETVRIAIDLAHHLPGSQTHVIDRHSPEREDAGCLLIFVFRSSRASTRREHAA